MRKIAQFERRDEATNIVYKAVAYYHADWQEFFVRFWINDVVQDKATYPASDRADAIATAEFFVLRERK